MLPLAGSFRLVSNWEQLRLHNLNATASVALLQVHCTLIIAFHTLLLCTAGDQLSKFIQLTYLIVGYNAKPEKSAALLAFLRVVGIISGGLLSLVSHACACVA